MKTIAIVLLSTIALAAHADQADLAQWANQQRIEAKHNVPPMPRPYVFKSEQYTASRGADPFSSAKMVSEPVSVRADAPTHRKEPLEAFPLDGFTMVGTITKAGARQALLRVNGLVYIVKRGDYLGTNSGRIVDINETTLSLSEVAQDARGDWVERPADLHLQ